jgi:hypothetical protein
MTAGQVRGQRRQPALPARSIAAGVLRTGRRHAGRILLVSIAVSLVATAVLVASGLESALPDPEGRPGIVVALVARSIVEGVLEALVGLLLVELAYRLIEAGAKGGRGADWTEKRGSEERASERRGKLGALKSAPGGAK